MVLVLVLPPASIVVGVSRGLEVFRGLTPFRKSQLLKRLVRSRLGQNLTAQSPDPRDTNSEPFSNHSVIIPVVIMPVVTVLSTQVVLVDCCADSTAQTRTCILVGSKMNPAVNASVGDVVGYLLE